MIYYITSKDNKKVKEVVEIRKNMSDENCPHFIIEGTHLLSMAIEENVVDMLFVISPLKDLTIDQYVVNDVIMKKMSLLQSPTPVLAVCKKKESTAITRDKVLYLDGIQDPGNLGTILRSALAFDYKDIILSPKCVSQFNSKVISSTQGALFALNIVNGDINLLKSLHSEYQLIATSLQNAQPVTSIKSAKKHILIMGSEGQGVSEEVLNISDYKTIIPIKNMESLNVAIATSIMLYILSSKEL